MRATFILLFFLSFGAGCYAAQDNAGSLKSAPAFKLTGLNGKEVSLSDYKGKKAVVLFFWTTWCPYCREEMRGLNQEYAELTKGNIGFLAINVGESEDKVRNFVKSRILDFEVLLDRYTTVADSYDLMGVPTYIVIDKSGAIVSTGNHFPKYVLKGLAEKVTVPEPKGNKR